MRCHGLSISISRANYPKPNFRRCSISQDLYRLRTNSRCRCACGRKLHALLCSLGDAVPLWIFEFCLYCGFTMYFRSNTWIAPTTDIFSTQNFVVGWPSLAIIFFRKSLQMQKKIFTFASLLSYMIIFDWRKPLIISVIYCKYLTLNHKRTNKD